MRHLFRQQTYTIHARLTRDVDNVCDPLKLDFIFSLNKCDAFGARLEDVVQATLQIAPIYAIRVDLSDGSCFSPP